VHASRAVLALTAATMRRTSKQPEARALAPDVRVVHAALRRRLATQVYRTFTNSGLALGLVTSPAPVDSRRR